MMKKLLALALALIMALGVLPAQAQGETRMYQGGVVQRRIPRGSEDSLLTIGYASTDSPYIVLGQPVRWDLEIGGGTAPYYVEVYVFYQDLTQDQHLDPWYTNMCYELEGEDFTFTYTFEHEMRYFVEVTVTDSAVQQLVYQTPVYEAYDPDDETDAQTTVGKVNSIVAEVITADMSAYTRARALHDWLIHNANYDYTYTHYDASGVLLEGTGVCDSYARAFMMLCRAAGVECIYVAGTAGDDPDPANWGNHAWNMIRLDGHWYHVDCTWDDPNQGGLENHEYFCVTDEFLAKTHAWQRGGSESVITGGMAVPETDAEKYVSSQPDEVLYQFTFASWDEFDAHLEEMIAKGHFIERVTGLYTGTEDSDAMFDSMQTWAGNKGQDMASRGLLTSLGVECEGDYFTMLVGWTKTASYMLFNETSVMAPINGFVIVEPGKYVGSEGDFTVETSDPNVAVGMVCPVSEGSDKLALRVSGRGWEEGADTCTLTVTSSSGVVDTLDVTIYPGWFEPDWNFTVEANEDGSTTFRWNSIPGATEYRLMAMGGYEDRLVTSTTGLSCTPTDAQLPFGRINTVYMEAVRCVGGEEVLNYISSLTTSGHIVYDAILPDDLIAIEAEAFCGSSVETVDIPVGTWSIGSRAFADCLSLHAVRVPYTVMDIATDAFNGSTLEYVVVEEGSFAEGWFRENCSWVEVLTDE